MAIASEIITGQLLAVGGCTYRVFRVDANHFGDCVLRLHLEDGDIPMDVTVIIPKEALVVTWTDEITEILSNINQI